MLNDITLLGRMTRDPELRRTGSGIAVANFTIAVERDHAGPNKEKETDFIDCVAWRGTGEFISKYFPKGSLIAVKGRLEIRKWTDKDGNSRRSAEVNVENAYFAGSKNDGGSYNIQSTGNQNAGGYDLSGYPETQAMYNRLATPVMADDYAMLTDDDAQLPF
jgi:single-strand DNA-binding protein